MRSDGASHVTGVGAVSCLGLGASAVVDGCLANGVDSPGGIGLDDEYGVYTGRVNDLLLAEIRRQLTSVPWLQGLLSKLDLSEVSATKPLLMTLYALTQAWGSRPLAEFSDDTGLIFATTTAHMTQWERALPHYVAGVLSAEDFAPSFRHYHLSRSLDALTEYLDFKGPVQVLTSACAAGAQALVLAHKWLQTGKVKRCLVGATETLTHLTVRGFECFNLLAPALAAPFDRKRDGINLSEASAFLCLESLETGRALPSLGRILGGATALDAFDLTRPHPEGRGLYQAMHRALNGAGCDTTDIAWLYAHGTGTQVNDLAESAAIGMLFAAPGPLVSSTKGAHGHALAASGLLETVAAIEAMRRQIILPNSNLTEPDPALRLRVVQQASALPPGYVLKTTLGFGGVNAAIVLGPAVPS